MLPKSTPRDSLEPFWTSLVVMGPKSTILSDFRTDWWLLFGGLLGHLFGTFCFSSLRDAKKEGSGRAFKTRPDFWSILGSARRASGGFPCTRELNFHFCSRTQKGLQNESQNGALGAPKSQLYLLWGTSWEKWVSKKVCQKRSQF